MSADRSILRQIEEQGTEVPRVQLPGAEAPSPQAGSSQRYQVLGEIARGGMGVVYKGRDTDLGRDVAMKVLKDDHLRSPELVQRFVEEAQIGGQLQHPGIVPVYELGMQEGKRPYFAMKLVKGRTLAELLAERVSPSEGRHDLLAHFAQACHTVAYAHSRGVVHRDLKPSNVMVGAFGEVQVVDWGFAKVLKRGGIDDERQALRGETVVATVRSVAEGPASVAGSLMGTPAYMPPEQALGQVDDLTERADVFSLGAILCEILTGKPPYVHDVLEAAAHARLEDAVARLDACGGDAELVALAKTCLAPLPKDRPRSAREVAEALGAHLAGAERRAHEARVRAAQEQVKAEEQRRARRQTLAVASSVLLVVLLGGGAWLAKGSLDAARERERVAGFEAAVRDATRLQASENDWPGALSAAERALGLAGPDAARRREAEALRQGIGAAAADAARAADKARNEAGLLATLDEIALRRGDRFDAKRTDDDLAAALPDFAALADFGRRVELAAHFDQWAWLRRTKLADRDWRPLDAQARALDPDGWRNHLRDAAAAGDMAALRALAADPATATQGARSLDLLGTILGEGGDREAAAELLVRAAERYPDDFWIQLHCGNFAGSLDEREGRFARPDGAIEHLSAAVALRPASAGAHDALAVALWSKGDLDAAVDVWRAALRLDPGNAQAHGNLGVGLRDSGDVDGAIAEFRESLRLDPLAPHTYGNLGSALERKGDLDGAMAAYREAIRVDPNDAAGHNSVGTLLAQTGDQDGALAAFREAIRLDPKLATAHTNLGNALLAKGDAAGAILSYREATRLDPDCAEAHANLGIALKQSGDLDGAIASYREAIRARPDLANAHANLAEALIAAGDVAGALASYRRAAALVPPGHEFHQWLAEAEQNFAAARERLAAMLRGVGRPQDAREWRTLAGVASFENNHAAAARCWREAFACDPRIAADPRGGVFYAAARDAVLAGPEWRGQALQWLRAALDAWGEQPPAAASAAARALREWKADPDLAAVRDGKDVPEEWRRLWADVDALLARVERER